MTSYEQIIEEGLAVACHEKVIFIRDPAVAARIASEAKRAGLLTECEWSEDLPGILATAGQFELGIVCLDRQLRPELLRPVLARLRDVHCARLLLLLIGSEGSTAISHKELLTLGFQSHPRALEQTSELKIYAYDIRTYKRTPRWLNPKGWANPELWDKYRW